MNSGSPGGKQPETSTGEEAIKLTTNVPRLTDSCPDYIWQVSFRYKILQCGNNKCRLLIFALVNDVQEAFITFDMSDFPTNLLWLVIYFNLCTACLETI